VPILIVVNSVKEWPFHIPGVEVVDARSYLTKPEYGTLRAVKLFNLCRSYRYQSTGYYVTLMATARGHRPLPGITTIQDLKSQTMVRFVSDELDDLIQQTLQPIHSNEFTLSVYFGRNLAKRYERLSLHLFNVFQAPLLRAQFDKDEKGHWGLRTMNPIPVGEIPEAHREFVIQVATDYFAGRRGSIRKRAPTKYDIAILVNPEDDMPPSNEKAIERFVKAAESMGLGAELIGRDDYARIAEFDALFIRETTRVNHYTYRFARRAATEGLVVIDDPESILKCANKVYLAELMTRNKVPIPRTLIVHKDTLEEVGPTLGYPVVLKEPDAAFSQGVVKVDSEADLERKAEDLLDKSDLIIAQEFLPTNFDWRIAVFDGQPLFACKYHMAHRHWQIIKDGHNGQKEYGRSDTMPVEIAPYRVVRTALKAANLIGDGLYGVDLKQVGDQVYVIEVNDNPNIDAGVEDQILKTELYRRIMSTFLRRIERKKAGWEDG
jgi:glutathione synthase/RimK-type ligase-like ATP-grasp enzyme